MADRRAPTATRRPRFTLLNTLYLARDRHELVTLTLKPVTGQAARGDVVATGWVVAIAEGYTSRRALVAVLERPGETSLAIGLTMIRHVRTAADDD